MFCASAIDILDNPIDRGLSERVKGKSLRPQTDMSRVKVLDVHGHGREGGDFVAKEAEQPQSCRI